MFDRDAFVFDDIGESSLRDKVSIVVARDSASGRERVVMKDLKTGEFRDVYLDGASCDEIVDIFCVWCESLARQRNES